jgi:hypothetical protein
VDVWRLNETVTRTVAGQHNRQIRHERPIRVCATVQVNVVRFLDRHGVAEGLNVTVCGVCAAFKVRNHARQLHA